MNSTSAIKPGFSLIHKHVKTLLESDCKGELFLCDKELKIMKEKLDDYLMYIWVQMGDTRYNRSGYRNAIETLSQHISNNFEEKTCQ